MYIERQRRQEAQIDARNEGARPMAEDTYRRWYLVYHEGKAFGTGTDPDRKNCGCFALLAHCSACESDRRRFEREYARRKVEHASGRMTAAEVRGITPVESKDWIDEISGRSS